MTMITQSSESMRLFLDTPLCETRVYSSLLRSHCLSPQLQCFYVLSCRWQKRSGCGQRASEESQIAYWILKAHPQKAESWQSPLAHAAKSPDNGNCLSYLWKLCRKYKCHIKTFFKILLKAHLIHFHLTLSWQGALVWSPSGFLYWLTAFNVVSFISSEHQAFRPTPEYLKSNFCHLKISSK